MGINHCVLILRRTMNLKAEDKNVNRKNAQSSNLLFTDSGINIGQYYI